MFKSALNAASLVALLLGAVIYAQPPTLTVDNYLTEVRIFSSASPDFAKIAASLGVDACSGIATQSCFLYNVSTDSWSIAGSMKHSRVFHTATLLPNGQVLVAGGQFGLNPGTNVLTSAELYTP